MLMLAFSIQLIFHSFMWYGLLVMMSKTMNWDGIWWCCLHYFKGFGHDIELKYSWFNSHALYLFTFIGLDIYRVVGIEHKYTYFWFFWNKRCFVVDFTGVVDGTQSYEDERRMIVSMCIAGMSTHCIATKLEMTQSTMFIVWKNFQ